MRRELVFIALLVLCTCLKFHDEKPQGKFRRFLKKLRNFTPEQFEKFQTEFLSDKKPINKETHRQAEIARKVNKLKTTWTATEYKRDYKPLLGAILDGLQNLPEKKFEHLTDVPEEYDPREAYPRCESLREIRDQANCGSCWAFGAVEAMSDRICIKSGQTLQTRVSAQNLLTCCYICGFGCDGGYPAFAWSYWKSTGIVTGGLYGDKNTCQPYFLPECDHHCEGSHGPCPDTVETPDCVKNCDDGNKKSYNDELTKGASAYSISGEANIKQEIYENGPVEGSFTVYEDFLTYKSGVYQHVTGSALGGHAIKILGWGVENGTKYWLCVNSWNEDWGDNGYFKIRRGTNECGMESGANAGLPDL
jgi:cathepsin B